MRKRTEDKRKAIIIAARELFLTHGYTATSMDAIAAKAKLTKRTVYGYFSDKRSLLLGVVDNTVGEPWEFHAPPQQIVTREGFTHALFAIASGLNDIISDPDYVRLLRVTITELPVQPDLNVLFERGATRRSLEAVEGLLRAAHEHELFIIGDTNLTARFFIGDFTIRVLLDGLLQPVSHIRKYSLQELEAYVEAFVGYLRTGG